MVSVVKHYLDDNLLGTSLPGNTPVKGTSAAREGARKVLIAKVGREQLYNILQKTPSL